VAEAYIAVSDIKHRHIKVFPSAELTTYVDDANEWFEDYAVTIGATVAEIVLPVTANVKKFILSYMYMEFSRDAIGADGTPNVEANNLYESIYAHAKDQYKLHKAGVIEGVLTQTAVTREDHAVNWGKQVRG